MPVFVDDITLACKDGAKIDSIVQELSNHVKLQDLGPTTQLLGLEIHRDCPNHCLSISQSQYISNLIQEHGLSDSKPVSTPLNPGTCLSTSMCPQNKAEALEMHQYPYISLVGCLMYLAVTTRPDIAYSARVLARFNSSPGLAHWQAAKHVLHYLKGTMDYKLVYKPSTSPEPFITYSDADHGGNMDNGKSTGGYVVKIGSGVVSWSSKLHPLDASVHRGAWLQHHWTFTAQNGQSVSHCSEQEPRAPQQDEALHRHGGVLFVASFGSVAYFCVCTTLQVILPYLDSLVRLIYPAEDGKMTLSLISSSAGE